MKKIFATFLLFVFCGLNLQAQLVFNNLLEIQEYAKIHHQSAKNAFLDNTLAKLTSKTAKGNVLNPRVPTTSTLINNTSLAANLLPAEIFGGPAGTYREVRFGQQFISSVVFSPQIDLYNASAIERVKSAKWNENLVATNAKLQEKAVIEQVNVLYFSILSARSQKQHLSKTIVQLDSLVQLVAEKVAKGISRTQELNETKLQVLNTQEKIQTLLHTEAQLMLQLRTLCQVTDPIQIADPLYTIPLDQNPETSKWLQESHLWQGKYLNTEYVALKKQQWPVVSAMANWQMQNNSNKHLLDGNGFLINATYVGLKMVWDLPTNVTKMAAIKTSEINLKKQAILNEAQLITEKNELEMLESDFEKWQKQYETFSQMIKLKEENYTKNKHFFAENILPLEKLLNSYNDLILSQSQKINALINWQFAAQKIKTQNQY